MQSGWASERHLSCYVICGFSVECFYVTILQVDKRFTQQRNVCASYTPAVFDFMPAEPDRCCSDIVIIQF
jgi:hypothetical protein